MSKPSAGSPEGRDTEGGSIREADDIAVPEGHGPDAFTRWATNLMDQDESQEPHI